MSEIPGDIMQLSWEMARPRYLQPSAQELALEIAKAIWSERQRCAKIAEDRSQTAIPSWDGDTFRRHEARLISQAILADNQEGE